VEAKNMARFQTKAAATDGAAKRRSVIFGAVVLVLMLAACQSAAQPAAPQGFGAGGQRPNFQVEPAKEVPTDTPAVTGMVASHSGDHLVVQQGFGRGGFGNPNGGTPRAQPEGTRVPRPTQTGDGTEVQVQVTSETAIYKDVTFANANGQPPSGSVQQQIEKSSLADIADGSRVTVWGEKSGDQVVAGVIVYSQLRNFQQP
jgi:hypothetical protein